MSRAPKIFLDKLPTKNYINLVAYTNVVSTIPNIQKWGPVTYFDSVTRTLYQPWGTDLLPHEFKKPVYNKNKFVFWIGSVWNDKLNRGNIMEIKKLKEVLKRSGLLFIKLRFIPDVLNIFFIRLSRIAPAISGKFQVDIQYLPCRVFKNISYGQLGITNILKFQDILGETFIKGDNMEELISNSIKLSKEDYISLVIAQQKKIIDFTYKNSINNIIKAIKNHD
jgi:hypothetical protein